MNSTAFVSADVRNRHGHKYNFSINYKTKKVTWTGPFHRTISRKVAGSTQDKIVSIDPQGGPRIAIGTSMANVHESLKEVEVANIAKISPSMYELKLQPVKKENETVIEHSMRVNTDDDFGF
jgi:hypothetical protein